MRAPIAIFLSTPPRVVPLDRWGNRGSGKRHKPRIHFPAPGPSSPHGPQPRGAHTRCLPERLKGGGLHGGGVLQAWEPLGIRCLSCEMGGPAGASELPPVIGAGRGSSQDAYLDAQRTLRGHRFPVLGQGSGGTAQGLGSRARPAEAGNLRFLSFPTCTGLRGSQSLGCHFLTEPRRARRRAMAFSFREATRATPGCARVWGGVGVGTEYQRWNLASSKGLEPPLLPISAPKSRNTAPSLLPAHTAPGATGSGQRRYWQGWSNPTVSKETRALGLKQ